MKQETKQLVGIAAGLALKVGTYIYVQKSLDKNIKKRIQKLEEAKVVTLKF